MEIGSHTFEEYIKLIKDFHGHVAPGMVIGGFMVDAALSNLPEGEFFDAISETPSCLPDAIQLLTPCTIGNGWMKIFNLGRYAMSLFEKYSGVGIRVYVDSEKLEAWPEIKSWFFKLKPKKDQDSQRLMSEIQEAGAGILSLRKVFVKPEHVGPKHKGAISNCPLCNEAYPSAHGAICRGCQGDAPYADAHAESQEQFPKAPELKYVSVEDAIGKRALHDMTQIIPGGSKGPEFKKGQVITVGDVCRLQQMGRQNVHTIEDTKLNEDFLHEDEAALSFASNMAGPGVTFNKEIREGKADFIAEYDGLLTINQERLEMFNSIPGVICATRHDNSMVSGGRKFAGTRAVPLFLPKSDFEKAMAVLNQGPLFEIRKLRKANVGILVTGTEVFRGIIKDSFIPIITNKIENIGSSVIFSKIVPDDTKMISDGVKEILDKGADLIITTAGLSVDPDDVTRKGLTNAGAENLLYGVPVLPGAMTLLAKINTVDVIGIPACALYFKTTAFDLLLPRVLAGIKITRKELALMGNGSFCLECKSCTYPKCSFGK